MKLYPINTGFFKLDGGAMFGVVPKSLWDKTNPSDENNMCSAEENLNKFKEELMQVTWNPQRKNMMKWCFSIDDQIE